MAGDTGYCVKCKKTQTIKNPKPTTMKNGRSAIKGECPVCGTGMFRIQAGKSKKGSGSRKSRKSHRSRKSRR